MTAMAASIGVDSALVTVEVIQVAGAWHRRVKLGAFGWWSPEACRRGDGAITANRQTPPADGVMCPVCWPVWPDVKR